MPRAPWRSSRVQSAGNIDDPSGHNLDIRDKECVSSMPEPSLDLDKDTKRVDLTGPASQGRIETAGSLERVAQNVDRLTT